MTQLSPAYAAAFFLIAVLLLFARKNRKEGWKKHRVPLYEEKPESQVDLPADHLGELSRLNQSLVGYGETTKPAKAEPAKKPVVLA